MPFDCQKCGACCRSEVYLEPEDYQAEQIPRAMVDVARGHMRFSVDHRCVALKGKIGACVTCSIYTARPAVCRRVEPGDKFCLFSRAREGLPGGEWDKDVIADGLAAITGRKR